MPVRATVQAEPSGEVSTRYPPVALVAESPHVSVGSIANDVTSTAAGNRTIRYLSVPAAIDQPSAWDWSSAALGPQP